ncbi:MAG: sugar ABC transporter ATP-binding protein, partial [Phyllobacterium sp.]
MKILAGLFSPTGGTVTLKGQRYEPKNPREAKALGLSIVFQELSLCKNLTVAENILATDEPNRMGFINEKALNARAAKLVDSLSLPIAIRARVGELSIAQQQLVEIAKGLSRPADVIIFDEPTSSLSDSEAELLFDIIERLKNQGAAIIYISHRMEEIMRLSDDITVMRDGEFVATTAKEATSIDKLITLMVGRQMQDIYPPRFGTPPDETVAPILTTSKLSAAGLFDDISLSVRPGEIIGLFGLIGSGRSDVMKALFGMVPALTGQISIDGKAVSFRSPADAIRNGIAFVTEDRKDEGLVLAHSVERNINMVALNRLSNRFGFAHGKSERAAAKAEVLRLAIKTASLDTPAGTLSGGNQQKIVLAKWLQMRPRILILDEPTRGVDVGAKFEIYGIIRQLAAEGTAILMVSSELPEILGLSDRVAVMHNGKIAAIADIATVDAEKVMKLAAGMNQ